MSTSEPRATPETAREVQHELTILRSTIPSPIPMRELFGLAKRSGSLDPTEIDRLLDRDEHDARVVAVSIMDHQARRPRQSEERRRALFELYIRRHDRIDTWDLVDRAAPYVVGGYLADRSRGPLYELAASEHWYERRTAIVATYYFIRKGDLADTFAIADLLAHDPHPLVQKAVGGWAREAGKRDRAGLLALLDRHAATMPRTALRYAVEQLDPELRQHYLGLAATGE